jgi:hypothetical protein
MWQLSLPTFQYIVKKTGHRWMIFDSFRKKFVALTPEEWVRQHYLHYIINQLHFPASLIAVEQQIDVNGQSKRCDAILYNNHMQAIAIFEFKAPHIVISQETFDQAAVYNSSLKLKYYFISNGINHYFTEVFDENKHYRIEQGIPDFDYLVSLNSRK